VDVRAADTLGSRAGLVVRGRRVVAGSRALEGAAEPRAGAGKAQAVRTQAEPRAGVRCSLEARRAAEPRAGADTQAEPVVAGTGAVAVRTQAEPVVAGTATPSAAGEARTQAKRDVQARTVRPRPHCAPQTHA
jgi:hypothetical protein